MPFDFRTVMTLLEEMGIMDVLLPFLLIFSITFAVFEKTKITGKKNVNVMIALVIALAVVIPHVTGSYPSGFDVVVIINAILPQISLVILAILLFMLISGLIAAPGGGAGKMIGVIVALLLILFIFFGTIGYFYDISWLYDFFGSEAVTFLIVMLVFALAIFGIVGGGKGEEAAEIRIPR